MGNFAKAMHVLQKLLTEVVSESIGLNPNYLQEEVEKWLASPGCELLPCIS